MSSLQRRLAETRGRQDETRVRQVDACGRHAEVCGRRAEACGRRADACGRQAEACGRRAEARVRQVDACGRHAEVCGRQVDACGRHDEVCRRQAEACGRQAEARGRQAENSVAAIWRLRGYSVLAQRLRTKCGEIDLVVADANTLVFVEVKARNSFAQAAYAVQPRQQARLLEAAGAAMAEHAEWQRPDIRFDVALVCGGAVRHIRDAIRY